MNLQFWAIWAVRENSSISLKYLTSEGNFYMFILANRFLLNDVVAALKSCVNDGLLNNGDASDVKAPCSCWYINDI